MLKNYGKGLINRIVSIFEAILVYIYLALFLSWSTIIATY